MIITKPEISVLKLHILQKMSYVYLIGGKWLSSKIFYHLSQNTKETTNHSLYALKIRDYA